MEKEKDLGSNTLFRDTGRNLQYNKWGYDQKSRKNRPKNRFKYKLSQMWEWLLYLEEVNSMYKNGQEFLDIP